MRSSQAARRASGDDNEDISSGDYINEDIISSDYEEDIISSSAHTAPSEQELAPEWSEQYSEPK